MDYRLRRGVNPGRVLGNPEADPCAGAERRLDHEAVVVAIDLAQARVHVAEADAVTVLIPGQDPAHYFGVGSHAVVLDHDLGLGALVGRRDGDMPDALLGLEAVTDRVLHQGLDRQIAVSYTHLTLPTIYS